MQIEFFFDEEMENAKPLFLDARIKMIIMHVANRSAGSYYRMLLHNNMKMLIYQLASIFLAAHATHNNILFYTTGSLYTYLSLGYTVRYVSSIGCAVTV